MSLVDQYTVLCNCHKWHLEKAEQVSEDLDMRRHKAEANKLAKRIIELERQLGLRRHDQ